MDLTCAKWLEAVCLIKSAEPEAMTAPRAREQRCPSAPPDRPPPPGAADPQSQTVSAAGRPAGFARLGGARRGLVRPARGLAAAALLALSGALALPATAEAQTTLVSNVAQSADGNKSDVQALGQGFTTGSNARGHTLTGVDVVSASSTGFTAKVCATDPRRRRDTAHRVGKPRRGGIQRAGSTRHRTQGTQARGVRAQSSPMHRRRARTHGDERRHRSRGSANRADYACGAPAPIPALNGRARAGTPRGAHRTKATRGARMRQRDAAQSPRRPRRGAHAPRRRN